MWAVLIAIGILLSTFVYKVAKAPLPAPAQEPHVNTYVEALKNALMTFHLSRICKDDFDEMPVANYSVFDGTKLPALAGATFEHACLSYISNKHEFRKDPFYTPYMEAKIDAIQKYLNKKFNTQDCVIDFLSQVVDPTPHKTP